MNREQMAIPGSDAFNWLIGPVARATTYVVDETKVAGTLHRSLAVLEGNEPFLRIARERLLAAGKNESVRNIDSLLREQPALSQWASELKADDYSVVNSHSLVGMWGAVEVAVEDSVVLILSKDPGSLDIVARNGVKTATFGPAPLSEEDGRRLYGRIEKELRRGLRVGEFYIRLFEMFGVRIECSAHVLSKLEEVNSVRNCLLHRGGLIDERAAQSSGALRPLVGKKITIPKSRYLEYYDAVGQFLGAMLKGVLACGYTRSA